MRLVFLLVIVSTEKPTGDGGDTRYARSERNRRQQELRNENYGRCGHRKKDPVNH
jgi:hypothetical protein